MNIRRAVRIVRMDTTRGRRHRCCRMENHIAAARRSDERWKIEDVAGCRLHILLAEPCEAVPTMGRPNDRSLAEEGPHLPAKGTEALDDVRADESGRAGDERGRHPVRRGREGGRRRPASRLLPNAPSMTLRARLRA